MGAQADARQFLGQEDLLVGQTRRQKHRDLLGADPAGQLAQAHARVLDGIVQGGLAELAPRAQHRPHCLARATVIETAEPHAIDHDQQALVEIARDAANRNQLELLFGTPHVKARHQLKNVIERLQAEDGDFLLCEDGDR